MSSSSPAHYAARVTQVFERIHREQMAGLPLLNNALCIATLGFQSFEGRVLGMVITPWMMSLLRFPTPQDDWHTQALGSKHMVAFPSGNYRFLVNVLDELGACQMHSLHSPMHPFGSQAIAIAQAQAFLDNLLVVPPGGVQYDPVDEELLGKIMRGEKVPPPPPQSSESHLSLTETT